MPEVEGRSAMPRLDKMLIPVRIATVRPVTLLVVSRNPLVKMIDFVAMARGAGYSINRA
jgi:hypothetical protein